MTDLEALDNLIATATAARTPALAREMWSSPETLRLLDAMQNILRGFDSVDEAIEHVESELGSPVSDMDYDPFAGVGSYVEARRWM